MGTKGLVQIERDRPMVQYPNWHRGVAKDDVFEGSSPSWTTSLRSSIGRTLGFYPRDSRIVAGRRYQMDPYP